MSKLQFEWNEAKAEANFAKHGLTFRSAVRVFLDPRVIDIDASRTVDGEERRKAIGMIDGRLSVVVYTLRGDVRRLISARRANRKEERHWHESH